MRKIHTSELKPRVSIRKSGGQRSCYTRTGAPKTAFETKKAAERAIPRTTTGLRAYRCRQHGWHLGH